MSAECRPYRPVDRDAVVAVFHATLVLGRRLPFRLAGAHEYAELSLGWFLDAELDRAAVWDDGERVVGYALAAADLDGLARAQRRGARALAGVLGRRVAARRLDSDSRRFWMARGRDALALARRSGREPARFVGHLNLLSAHRAGVAGRRLVEHIDRECAVAGHDRWYGEVNAPAGRRRGAIRRYGMDVAWREPNHTLTRLVGEPVERLVTVRVLDRARRFAAG